MTVSSNRDHGLSGVAETLWITLYVRALESRRPDALLRDDRAVALVAQRPAECAWVEKIKLGKNDRVAIVLRSRELDRHARDFLAHHPAGVVVHIGCGLDTRFERVDDGRVQWYDLDLPEVIELRRELIGDEGPRHHLVACSVFESTWMDAVDVHHGHVFMFIAEGVFMWFEESRIRSLVLTLQERFPGAELVFDACSPFVIRVNTLLSRLSRTTIVPRYLWALRHARDPEAWGEGISLLDEWYPFDRPEPRLTRVRWVRHVPPLAKIMGIFHYRLGDAP
jgi:O-methyltransferase involved in polyketide biosynthesis